VNIDYQKGLLLICGLACIALPAVAADRMRAGQWEETWTGAGRTKSTSSCVTQEEADAINGDVDSVRAHLEKVIPPSVCMVTDIKVDGSRIVYTAVCSGGKANVITMTYHGDSFESVDSNGARAEARRVGSCE
jgi:Protein of unknown function (DUF3617)